MVPKHIAIIMDGNGRWAQGQGKPRTFGHKAGSETLKQICRDAYDLGVEYVTVYAFSTENWKRSTEEVGFLMNLLRQYLKESIKNAKENNMRVRVIGRREDLDKDIQQSIASMEEATKDFDGLQLQIALNYGGRDELVRSVRNMMVKAKEEGKSLDDLILSVDEDQIGCHLDTQDIPDPELLIRTSGEYRLSNFLVWQSAYTEFYFADVHWPDFNRSELEKAITSFQKRDRRFGGIKNAN